ncbi:MAG: amino acid adenylation domain-containing protein [Rickettsiaceae bacterium]|nr:amino acid adenylation domain-containing protein [Rickettsiaceae bacterium]
MVNITPRVCLPFISKEKDYGSELPVLPRAEDIAFIQFTSGSTSHPKGVIITHANIMANQLMIKEAFKHDARSRIVSWLPLFHDMGLIGGVLHPLYLGTTGVLMRPEDVIASPIRWLQAISTFKATTSGAPNFAYDLCVRNIDTNETKDINLSTWKLAFCGSEAVRASTLESFSTAFKSWGFKSKSFFPCYGLAEATLFVAGGLTNSYPKVLFVDRNELKNGKAKIINKSVPSYRKIVSCGFPTHPCAVKISDPNSNVFLDDECVGEIVVSGPHVSKGYWKQQLQTKISFFNAFETEKDFYLRTGDLGFLYKGELYVVGRKKDIIISRGNNIHPEDIEDKVKESYSNIRECIVFQIIKNEAEEIFLVAEVNKNIKEAELSKLTNIITRMVSSEYSIHFHKIIFVSRGKIPRTTSGKVQRLICREMYENSKLDILFEFDSINYIDNEIIEKSKLLSNWDLISPIEQQDILTHFIVNYIVKNFKVSRNEICVNTDTLIDLGLDSLAVLRMGYTIQLMIKISLDYIVLFKGKSIAKIVDEIIRLKNKSVLETALISVDSVIKESGISLELPSEYQALWILYKLSNQKHAYHLPYAIRISGQLNMKALDKAFFAIIKRHSFFRSIFFEQDGVVHIKICDRVTPKIEIIKISRLNLAGIIQNYIKKPFNLTEETGIRIILFCISNDEYVLLSVFHHLISDFYSLIQFFKELNLYYLNEYKNLKYNNGCLDNDFVYSIRDRLNKIKNTCNNQEAIEYWKNILKDTPSRLNLPFDHINSSYFDNNGDKIVKVINKDLLIKIRSTATKHGVTPFVFNLSVFAILLAHYCNESDFIIGVPITTRSDAKTSELFGYFVNILPVRIKINGSENYKDFLKNLNEQIENSLSYGYYPYNQLNKLLDVNTPEIDSLQLFQVTFNFLENDPDNLLGWTIGNHVNSSYKNFGNCKILPFEIQHTTSLFDISINILSSTIEGIIINWEFSKSFSKKTIECMAGSFLTILENVIEFPDVCLDKIEVVDKTNQYKITKQWNSTKVPYDLSVSLVDRLFRQVALTPFQIAIIDENINLNYTDLWKESISIASLINKKKKAEQQIIPVLAKRDVHLLSIIYGIFISGCIYLPVDPSWPNHRIIQVIESANSTFILTNFSERSQLLENEFTHLNISSFEEALKQPIIDEKIVKPIPPEFLAYVLFTSGSTGNPKGVMNQHKATLNHALHMIDALSLNSRDTIVQNAPISFDVSLWQLITPVLVGAKVYVLPEKITCDPLALCREISKGGITILQIVPTMLRAIIEEVELGNIMTSSLLSLRYLISTGEILTSQLCQRWFSLFPNIPIVNAYGPAECADDVLLHFIHSSPTNDDQVMPVGKPIANTHAYVLSKNGNFLPIGLVGYIYIGGLAVGQGYLGDTTLTNEKFIFHKGIGEKLFCTGDLGRYQQDGTIVYHGRNDYQVKISGIRIELQEIEHYLRLQPGIKEVVVVKSNFKHDKLIAYIEVEKTIPLDKDNLNKTLKQFLPQYMIPYTIITLDSIPLTPNGKIDRNQLSDRPLYVVSEEENFSNLNKTQKILIEVCSMILGKEMIRINSNIFELGANSIDANRIVSRLKQILKIEINLKDLFKYPVIKDFAYHIDNYVYPTSTQILSAIKKTNFSIEKSLNKIKNREES